MQLLLKKICETDKGAFSYFWKTYENYNEDSFANILRFWGWCGIIALEYFDDLIAHNDLNYKREAPCLDLKTIDFQLGVGGCHGFSKFGTYIYDRGDGLSCE